MDLELTHQGVEVRVLDGPCLEEGKPTADAVAFHTQLIERMDDIRRYVADKMLSLYNEDWRDPEDAVIDADEFMRRLQNPAVTLYDELGAAEIYFDDGDLFGGHWIDVSVENGKPVDVKLAG